jgi:ketosteroid isomerase-like protein
MALVSRDLVDSFYDAVASGDATRVVAFLADRVDWLILGPVDFAPFCGQRRSKAEVFEVFDQLIPQMLNLTGCTREYILIDRDRVALLGRLTGTQRRTDRIISFRFANFMRFRDGKIVEYRAIGDTLDAVEQMLGRQVDLSSR